MPKIILITGCSSGFGKETALTLAKQHHVIATMRNTAKKTSLLDQYNHTQQPTDSGSLTVLPLDVTKKEVIQNCIQTVIQRFKRIDCLINNAGYGLGGFFEDLSHDDIQAQFETNTLGVMAVTRTVLPHMRAQKSGRIIMISSMAGIAASPALSAYNASKFALEGFSESLLFEVQPFGIDIALIEPGAFKTAIFTDNLRLGTHHNDPNSAYYAWTQQLLKKVETGIEKLNQNPSSVVSTIEKAVLCASPKFRYTVGKDAWLRLLMKRCLPFRVYKNLILLFFKKTITNSK